MKEPKPLNSRYEVRVKGEKGNFYADTYKKALAWANEQAARYGDECLIQKVLELEVVKCKRGTL